MNVCFAKALRAASLLLVALTATPAVAADLRSVVVDRDEGRYILRSETLLDTTQKDIYELLTDYDQFVKFTSAIEESRNLEPDEHGRPQFYTRMEGCVLWFCITFERYGHLTLTPHSRITATVDPQKSDFKHSIENWELIEEEEGTLLIYEFEVEPDFWVPPVVGPFYIRRALKAGAVDAVERIEDLAQGREPEIALD